MSRQVIPKREKQHDVIDQHVVSGFKLGLQQKGSLPPVLAFISRAGSKKFPECEVDEYQQENQWSGDASRKFQETVKEEKIKVGSEKDGIAGRIKIGMMGDRKTKGEKRGEKKSQDEQTGFRIFPAIEMKHNSTDSKKQNQANPKIEPAACEEIVNSQERRKG